MKETMKPISPEDRKVVNIKSGEYKPLLDDDGRVDGEVLQLNPNHDLGCGFHVYWMPPGHTTTRHVHDGDEDFLILEGEIVDHDGFSYRQGDLVWLKSGTEHNSYTEHGALIAVFFRC